MTGGWRGVGQPRFPGKRGRRHRHFPLSDRPPYQRLPGPPLFRETSAGAGFEGREASHRPSRGRLLAKDLAVLLVDDQIRPAGLTAPIS